MFSFKKLTLDDKTSIDNFNQDFSPYSDFNFTSLWCYNTENDTEIFLDENCYVIKMRDYMTSNFFYSFLSKKDTSQITEELINLCKSENLELKLRLVPEDSINKLDTGKFLIEEDRDSFDYILSVDDSFAMDGKKYRYNRHSINKFIKNYTNYQIKVSDCKNISEQVEIKRLFESWASTKSKEDVYHETKALNRLFNSIEQINVVCITIWIENKLIAYEILENLNRDFAIGHFMKADKSYEDIYDMLYYQLAKYLNHLNCKFLNYEQDLGIPNLRQAKLEQHPSIFLKKYTISPK